MSSSPQSKNAVCIRGISYYLPRAELTNEALVKVFPNWTEKKIARTLGISTRHVASDGELSSDLAAHAAEALFADFSIERDEVDFLILCTQSPDYLMPSTSCIAHEKIGLRKSTGSVGVDLGCSGFVYSLALASGLVSSGIASNVLLITSDVCTSHSVHAHDASTRLLCGDAAAACLISRSGPLEIGNFVFGTDGSGAESLMVQNGGWASWERTNDARDCIRMEGEDILRFTLREIPPLIEAALAANKMSRSDIGCWVFHQANKFINDSLSSKLELPKERVYFDISESGNTASCTVPIALRQCFDRSFITDGMNVMISGFGVGLSWAAAVLKYNEVR